VVDIDVNDGDLEGTRVDGVASREGRGGGAQEDAEVVASIGLVGREMTREGRGGVTTATATVLRRGSHIGTQPEII
jgi:hypothetical protein